MRSSRKRPVLANGYVGALMSSDDFAAWRSGCDDIERLLDAPGRRAWSS